MQRALARQRSHYGPSVPVNWVRAREVGALGGGDPGPQAADSRLPVGSLFCDGQSRNETQPALLSMSIMNKFAPTCP